MGLLENESIIGFMCPGCFIFSLDPNEISDKNGTCVNCANYYVLNVEIFPLEKGEEK